MLDNQIAKIVNEIRDLAIQFHDSDQLRERIAHVMVPLLKTDPQPNRIAVTKANDLRAHGFRDYATTAVLTNDYGRYCIVGVLGDVRWCDMSSPFPKQMT